MKKERKPDGYWTEEKVLKEAKKYKTKKDFKMGSSTAYGTAQKLKIIDKACSHMVEHKKPNGYWTIEVLNSLASKYTKRSEFKKEHPSAYATAQRKKVLDKICSHMTTKIKKKNYWSKTKIIEVAQNYERVSDFRRENVTAYHKSHRMGWLEEVCRHMIKEKSSGYWTFDKVRLEALKYKTRTEFQKKSSGAYDKALSNGWVDEICDHMDIQGNHFLRAIYAFEFSDRSVYVGLTYNYSIRYNDHMTKNELIMKKTEELGHEFIQFNEFYSPKEAMEMEKEKLEEYRGAGWKILNKNKTGGLGGKPYKITKEHILIEARKYQTIIEFRK